MKRSGTGWTVLAVLLIAMGCRSGETLAPLGDMADLELISSGGSLTEPGSSYPDSSDAGQFAGVIWVTANMQSWFGSTGHAYGAGVTQGYANTASQSMTMQIISGTTVGQTVSKPPVSFSVLWPRLFVIRDTIVLPSAVTCGASSLATIQSSAHLRVIANYQLFDLFPVEDSDQGTGYLNPCPPPSECDDVLTAAEEQCPPIEPGGGPITSEVPGWTPRDPFAGSSEVCETYTQYTSWDGGRTWRQTGYVITNVCWTVYQT